MSIIDIIRLEHYDENYAPPERPVLEVALIGDCLHLTIAEYSETHEVTTSKVIADIAVDVEQLDSAVELLVSDQITQDSKADIPFQERTAYVVES
jgi:hypothetical protein